MHDHLFFSMSSTALTNKHPQGEYPHRARTASAPRQVFEQLPSEMVYWERSCKWYLVGS